METSIPIGARTATPSDVCAQLRKGSTWLWNRRKTDQTFPKPFYISPREPLFFQHEIDAWLELHAAKRVEDNLGDQ